MQSQIQLVWVWRYDINILLVVELDCGGVDFNPDYAITIIFAWDADIYLVIWYSKVVFVWLSTKVHMWIENNTVYKVDWLQLEKKTVFI